MVNRTIAATSGHELPRLDFGGQLASQANDPQPGPARRKGCASVRSLAETAPRAATTDAIAPRPHTYATSRSSCRPASGVRGPWWAVLGVGLGSQPEDEYDTFSEMTDTGMPAGGLDEGLEVLAGLWPGRPFSSHGATIPPPRRGWSPATYRLAAARSALVVSAPARR
jgi:hypothetical protein